MKTPLGFSYPLNAQRRHWNAQADRKRHFVGFVMLRLIYYFQVEDDRRILGTFCEQASSLAPIFAKTEFLYILSFSTNHFPMYFNATFSLVDGTSYTISMVFMVQSCFTSLRKIIKYFEVETINSFSHAKDASSSQIKRNR